MTKGPVSLSIAALLAISTPLGPGQALGAEQPGSLPTGAWTLQQWTPGFNEVVVGSPANDEDRGVTLFGQVYKYPAICAADGLILSTIVSAGQPTAVIAGGGHYLFAPDQVSVDPNDPDKVESTGCPDHVGQHRLFSGDLSTSESAVKAAALAIAAAKAKSAVRFKRGSDEEGLVDTGGERAAVAALRLRDISDVGVVSSSGNNIYRIDFKDESEDHWVLTVTCQANRLNQIRLVEISTIQDAVI